jgi:hypothetical protein
MFAQNKYGDDPNKPTLQGNHHAARHRPTLQMTEKISDAYNRRIGNMAGRRIYSYLWFAISSSPGLTFTIELQLLSSSLAILFGFGSG